MSPTGTRALLWLLRLLVAGVFFWAAVPKMSDPAAFAQDIHNYRLVPPDAIPWLAAWLPPVEAAVGAALLIGPIYRGAALLAGGLLVCFTAAMTQAVVRGIDLTCGCFGSAASSEVGWWALTRNLALILACAFLVKNAAENSRGQLSN